MKRILNSSFTQFAWVALLLAIASSCNKKDINLPEVATTPFSDITTSSAMGGGDVIDDGDGDITARGVCWSTSPSPTVSDGNTQSGAGMGTFFINITDLLSNTLYYVRAYATNSEGTGYGEELLLKTMWGTITDYDGNVYQTVQIGLQLWMAENLKVTHYRNGEVIPLVTGNEQWTELTSGAYSWYDNDYQTYGQYYGALYNWYALVDPSEICPDGWHSPSLDEWQALFNQLGGAAIAGGKLKSVRTGLNQQPYWMLPNRSATNESGFSAFPGGFRSYFGGSYSGLGPSAYWWSTTPSGENIEGTDLETNSGTAGFTLHGKNSGVSIRCIRD